MVGPITALKFWNAFGVWPRGNAGSRVETVLRETWFGLLNPWLPVRVSNARKVVLEKFRAVAEAAGFSSVVQKIRLEMIKRIDQGITFTSYPGNQQRR